MVIVAFAAWFGFLTHAQAGSLIVTNGSSDDPRLTGVTRAASEDSGPPRVIGVGAFVDLFDVVSVVARTADDDCGGVVSLDQWRGELDDGRAQAATLQTSRALSTFAAAELETACLDKPPAASDLVRLELALADLHRSLTTVGDDAEERASHQTEADNALDRAALFGLGLAAPPGFDVDLLDEFDARRDALAATDGATRQPRILFAGQVIGTRLNGRPVDGVSTGVAGLNLVQAVDGGKVTAAALIRLKPGSSTLVWVMPGGQPRSSGDVALALGALARGHADDGLLAAAAMLVGDARYAVSRADAIDVYSASGGALSLVDTVDARQRLAVDAWHGAIGVGPLVRFAVRPGGPEDAGGLAAGLTLAGSWAVRPELVLGLAVRPAATRASLPPESGGGSRFRATIPIALEGRWERADRALTPVLGAQVGMDVLGGGDPTGFYGAALGGVARGIGQAGALRAEARIGGGPGLIFADLSVGTELRF